jgi:hypothetical protein
MVAGLSWMNGGAVHKTFEVRNCHRDVWRDLKDSLDELGSAEASVPTEVARALLRQKAGHRLDDATLRPYNEDLLSLPLEALTAPRAVDLLGPAEETLLERLHGQ